MAARIARVALDRDVLEVAPSPKGGPMLPRQFLHGDLVHVTRLCAGRLARLRPSEKSTQLVTYCLARAARRHGIEVIAFAVMSTHVLCAAAHKRCYAELGVMRSEAGIR